MIHPRVHPCSEVEDDGGMHARSYKCTGFSLSSHAGK